MISFFASLIILIAGYVFYGRFVEKVFHPTDQETPAYRLQDGVDFIPMSPWRAYMIQLLNIAGLGPIFGAISGALWGPVVYIWIVLGTIFAGGVHDYLCGMLSERNNGASIPEIVGYYLGPVIRSFMRVFSVILLEMVGVVFMVGPAGLLNLLTGNALGVPFWTILILVYYFLATILPIDQIIGRLYPFFGACLIIMAVSIAGATVLSNGVRPMPELWANFHSLYPGNALPIWPLMCITVACGAISGFHSTQSPAMARCLKNEHQGRVVFYGAMVSEGIIALIWAAAAIAFFYNKDGAGTGLQALLTMEGGNSTVVYLMSTSLLKGAGAVLAMLGVIACPITSGDTAFRSARLTLSDWFNIDQKPLKKRLMLALPLLGAGYFIFFLNYTTIWRYFSWSNQVLATVGLWACAVYLSQEGSKKIYRWMAGIPAVFMSAVTFAYILQAEEGFRLPGGGSNIAGVVFAVVLLGLFIVKTSGKKAEWESA